MFDTIRTCLFDVFKFINNSVLTLQVNGISLLNWLIGLLMMSIIVAAVLSYRFNIPHGVKRNSSNDYKRL